MKDIEYLQLFIEVNRWGSFSEAARQINQSTTTLNRKIQLLEAQLNTKLFHRTTRSLSLTEMGQRLLPKAQLIIETTQEMKLEVETHTDTPSGRIHISSSTTILEQVAPLLAEFVKLHPQISFNLESASRYVDLAELGIDFAFRLGPLSDSSLISMPIAPLEYVLVGEKAFVEAGDRLQHPKELHQWPCIRTYIEGYFFPWRFEQSGDTYDFDADNFIVSNDLRVCTQMVLSGTGLGYLPIRLVNEQLKDGSLVSLLEDWIPKPRELYLVYINRKHLPSKSRAFIDFARENKKRIHRAINGRS